MSLNAKFWEKYFGVYDVLNHVIPYKEMLDAVVDSLDIKPGDLILDAGAGTGNLAVKLHKDRVRVVALDSSIEGLDKYKKKFDDAITVVGDLNKKLPFEDQHFDHVYSVNTIHFLSPEKRTFVCNEFYRVLKPGGNITLVSLREGYRPLFIYKDHIKKCVGNHGFWNTLKHLAELLGPTFRMFYYGLKIKRHTKGDEEGKLMSHNEQIDLLENAGFDQIASTSSIFADQAIINTARKI